MKALDYLYAMKKANEDMGTEPITIYEAIKEIEDLIQENKSLSKTLEKYNDEMIKLRIENQELKSRSCVTCKYATLDSARYLPVHKCLVGCSGVDYDFYCNKWSAK